MTIRVFVSYRRSDSRHATGRLRTVLAREFGRENVFYDVDSVGFGADFRDVINVTLEGVDVLIVVIGPNFELQRLAQPNDYVHMEILEALRLGKAIVPVLVDEAEMPTPDQLPVELASLAYRNAAPLRADPDFDTDAARLVRDLRKSSQPTAADDATPLAPPTGPRVSDPTQGAIGAGLLSSAAVVDGGSTTSPAGPPIIIQTAPAPRQRTAAVAIGIALLALVGAVVAVVVLRSPPQATDQPSGSGASSTPDGGTTTVAPTTIAVTTVPAVPTTAVATTPPTTVAPTAPPTAAPVVPAPAPAVPINPTPASSVSAGQAADLIVEYFRAAGTHVDYPAAWEFLSTNYQNVYGYDRFVSFWESVDTVEPSTLDATEVAHDADEITISAPVFFNLYSGVHSEERITVTVIRDPDGRLLLDRYRSEKLN